MAVTEVVTALYLAVPVVSTISWVPQVTRLAKDPALGVAMSIPTWLIWSLMGLVTLAYAAIVAKDIPFVVASAVNAAGQLTVTVFAVASRFRSDTPH